MTDVRESNKKWTWLFVLSICVILLIGAYYYYNWYWRFGVEIVSKQNRKKYEDEVYKFQHELIEWYPLGTDEFRIDYGTNYFKYFDRLGDLKYIVCRDGWTKKIVASVCLVLRELKRGKGESAAVDKVWFIADLKVHPDYRDLHLPYRMLYSNLDLLKKTSRFYCMHLESADNQNTTRNARGAITEDNFAIEDDDENELMLRVYGGRIGKLINKICRMDRRIGTVYNQHFSIYLLNVEDFKRVEPIISEYFGRYTTEKVIGWKDLILRSDNSKLNLVHVVPENSLPTNMMFEIRFLQQQYLQRSQDKLLYMFCCPKNGAMDSELVDMGYITNISATLTSNYRKPFHIISSEF